MTTKTRPDGETRHLVLECLIREADMDGLVTLSESEIGAVVGVSRTAVNIHLHSLAAEGVLAIVPNGSGYKSLNAIQLSEAVCA